MGSVFDDDEDKKKNQFTNFINITSYKTFKWEPCTHKNHAVWTIFGPPGPPTINLPATPTTFRVLPQMQFDTHPTITIGLKSRKMMPSNTIKLEEHTWSWYFWTTLGLIEILHAEPSAHPRKNN